MITLEGVVLLAATNDLAAVDPAIRREGRFDTALAIQPPGQAGLAQILRQRLDVAAEPGLEARIDMAARRMMGSSGAAAAALARAVLARQRDGGTLSEALQAELDARYPAARAVDDRRMALHEAGHVVVGLACGLDDPQALYLGTRSGRVIWPGVAFHTRETALALLRMLLAGHAAEEVCLGAASSGAGSCPQSDLAQATRLLCQMELEWGMGDGGLIWHSAAPAAVNHTLDWMRPKLAHMLKAAHSEARAIIATHRPLVERFAERLMAERELTGPALAALLAEIKDALGRSVGCPPRDPDAGIVPLHES